MRVYIFVTILPWIDAHANTILTLCCRIVLVFRRIPLCERMKDRVQQKQSCVFCSPGSSPLSAGFPKSFREPLRLIRPDRVHRNGDRSAYLYQNNFIGFRVSVNGGFQNVILIQQLIIAAPIMILLPATQRAAAAISPSAAIFISQRSFIIGPGGSRTDRPLRGCGAFLSG